MTTECHHRSSGGDLSVPMQLSLSITLNILWFDWCILTLLKVKVAFSWQNFYAFSETHNRIWLTAFSLPEGLPEHFMFKKPGSVLKDTG